MTRPLTLPEYRALLADVAGRHGGDVHQYSAMWYFDAGRNYVLARLELASLSGGSLDLVPELRCGQSTTLSRDPTAALSDLDAARATLERAIAARDELAGVVVDVSRGAP